MKATKIVWPGNTLPLFRDDSEKHTDELKNTQMS